MRTKSGAYDESDNISSRGRPRRIDANQAAIRQGVAHTASLHPRLDPTALSDHQSTYSRELFLRDIVPRSAHKTLCDSIVKTGPMLLRTKGSRNAQIKPST